MAMTSMGQNASHKPHPVQSAPSKRTAWLTAVVSANWAASITSRAPS